MSILGIETAPHLVRRGIGGQGSWPPGKALWAGNYGGAHKRQYGTQVPHAAKRPAAHAENFGSEHEDTSGTKDQPVTGVGHIPAVADNHPGHLGRLLVSGSVNQGATEPGSLRGDEPRPASLCSRLESSQPETWWSGRSYRLGR